MRQASGEGSPAGSPVNPEPAVGPDLSFVPTDYHTEGKPDLTRFSAHYQELAAADAQRREAMANVPEDGNYQFGLPDDLTFDGLDLPEGFTVNLMTDDPAMQPLYGELGGFLKELGAPKEAATKAAAMIAKYEAIKESQRMKAWTEDIRQLGNDATISARVQTVQRKLEALLPADQASALFSGDRISAKGIQALEKLLGPKNLSTPTATPQGQNLEGMSPYDRLKAINAAQSK